MNNSVDFHQIVKVAGDAVVVSDPEGVITVWNPAAERIFGFSEAEALGKSLDLIVPERLRERHWDGYNQTMRSGETRYGSEVLRVPAITQDGSSISIAFTVALLYEGEAISGILAIIREETERFRQERALKSRIAELERQIASTGADGAE